MQVDLVKSLHYTPPLHRLAADPEHIEARMASHVCIAADL